MPERVFGPVCTQGLAYRQSMPCGRTLSDEASCFSGKARNLLAGIGTFLVCQQRNFCGLCANQSESGREMDGFLANQGESGGQMREISGFSDTGSVVFGGWFVICCSRCANVACLVASVMPSVPSLLRCLCVFKVEYRCYRPPCPLCRCW